MYHKKKYGKEKDCKIINGRILSGAAARTGEYKKQ